MTLTCRSRVRAAGPLAFLVACCIGACSGSGAMNTLPGNGDAGGDATANDTGAIPVGDAGSYDPGEAPTDAAELDASEASIGQPADAASGSEAGDASSGKDAADAGGDAIADASDGEDAIADASDASTHDAAGDGAVCPATQLFVDAVNGHDTSSGASSAPLKTITTALALAGANTCIATVQVAPGTYSAANGEVFPLVVPVRVALIGDETGKGAAASGAVFIDGAGAYPAGPTVFRAAVVPSSGSTIAGFKITSELAEPDAGTGGYEAIVLDSTTMTTEVPVRNCTLINTSGCGIYILTSTAITVTGNVSTKNGYGFYLGGSSTAKFESNTITQNIYGVELDSSGGDLGGGALSSAGNNTLSCNTANDLWCGGSGVFAENDVWDHVPPTTVVDAGHPDIFSAGALPNATGASLTAAPCP
jgi:parallel beta-helix repeat protein